MNKIAIVTVDFNSHKETHDCIASLEKLDTKNIDLEIIVVDNASTEPLTLSEKEKKDGIILLRSEENRGFSGGNNMGIAYALKTGVDYIMLLNNDTYVDKNLLQECIKAFSAHQNLGVIVPKIYFAKGHEFHKKRYKASELGKVLWYAGGSFDWNNIISIHRGVDEIDHGQYDKNESTDFATGCCMFVKKTVFERVGVFNDDYFLYYEDADLSMRITRAGFRILYEPKAIIWHITAASAGGSGSILHDYYLTRNRMIFGLSYAPIRSKIALLRESIRLLLFGREWQKKGIKDFYTHTLGKGSFGS